MAISNLPRGINADQCDRATLPVADVNIADENRGPGDKIVGAAVKGDAAAIGADRNIIAALIRRSGNAGTHESRRTGLQVTEEDLRLAVRAAGRKLVALLVKATYRPSALTAGG